MAIYGISGIERAVNGAAASPSGGGRSGSGFLDALGEAVQKVNDLQMASRKEVQQLVTGETEDLHRTMLAVQRAELAFDLMMEVRNKVVQAYQEVMRTQA